MLHGARQFIAGSRVRDATLASDDRMLHFDPLYASPSQNSFLAGVVPFLRRLR